MPRSLVLRGFIFGQKREFFLFATEYNSFPNIIIITKGVPLMLMGARNLVLHVFFANFVLNNC